MMSPVSGQVGATTAPPAPPTRGPAALCPPLPPSPPIPLCGSHALHHACVSCAFLYCQKGTARPLQRSRTDSLSCVRKHGTCVGLAQLPFSCAERVLGALPSMPTEALCACVRSTCCLRHRKASTHALRQYVLLGAHSPGFLA